MSKQKPLLEILNLKKHFDLSTFGKKRILTAVDGIDLTIYEGETLGLVGESGCGKSTTGKLITQLYHPTTGSIIFNGTDYSKPGFEKVMLENVKDKNKFVKYLYRQYVKFNLYFTYEKKLKYFRSKVQMIFQDPYASLNPRMTVQEIIMEGMRAHKTYPTRAEMQEKAYQLIERVGLKREHASRYPHEFSGGQRQRIGIARALSLNPKMIVADEPISALDVSIQAQVINMLEDLQDEFGLTYLFIAHDLSMVHHISDRIGVMYLGKMMELGDSDLVYTKPLHPYTKALLSAIPIADPRSKLSDHRTILQGDVTSPINPKEGCRFASRCPFAKDKCFNETPEMEEVQTQRFVACHYVKEINDLNT
jgi:oligopeptide/dipeptide ABC transporter ATP-binding protein